MLNAARKKTAHLSKHFKPQAYIVSYPKSGRTWLRLLIGKSLCEKHRIPEDRMLRTRYVTSAAGILRTRFIHDGSATFANRPYTALCPDKSEYKKTKVVLLVRNIKDTLVSAYFQASRRTGIFEGSLSDFIRSDNFGAIKILTFYRHWHEQRHIPADFLLLRYEDLHKTPGKTLEAGLRFLGAKAMAPEIIRTAVDYCRFDNLRKFEAEKKFKSGILSPKDPNDPESFKTRKGLVGNYTQYLSASDIRYIDEQIARHGCEFTDYS